MTDYLLVASDRMHVEHYVRQKGSVWTLTDYDLPEHRVPLLCLDCELPLAEIYERVNFPPLWPSI